MIKNDCNVLALNEGKTSLALTERESTGKKLGHQENEQLETVIFFLFTSPFISATLKFVLAESCSSFTVE